MQRARFCEFNKMEKQAFVGEKVNIIRRPMMAAIQ